MTGAMRRKWAVEYEAFKMNKDINDCVSLLFERTVRVETEWERRRVKRIVVIEIYQEHWPLSNEIKQLKG